jgi:zinc protease
LTSALPVPGPIPRYAYPEIPCRELASGLHTLCLEDPYLPQVVVQVAWPRGSAHDPDALQGLSPLTAEMLKEGTASRSAREIATWMDRLAMEFEVDVQPETTCLSLVVLEPHLEAGVELLADLVKNPSFPELELERVKSRWRSLLAAQRAEPGFLAVEALVQALFPGHPYGRAAIPTETLDRISPADMRNLVRQWPMPGTVLGWAGRIAADQAEGLALRYFQNWRLQPADVSARPPVPPSRGRQVYLVDRPGSVQVRLALGRQAPALRDPEYLGLKLTNQAFGGGASSRLFLNLREQKGLTYGIYSVLQGYQQAGLLMVSASLRASGAAVGIAEILGEMERLREDPPSGQELERSRAELTGGFLRRLETPGSISSLEISRRLAGLPFDFYSRYVERLADVDRTQTAELAALWFNPDDWSIVAVGDRRELEPQLAAFGELRLLRAGETRLEPWERA